MTTAYTPGPLVARNTSSESWPFSVTQPGDPYPIAQTHLKADARLYAAAPDLLAACEALLPCVESMDLSDEGDATPPFILRARAAIARARGGAA